MKGGKMQVVCPGCKAQYSFSQLGLVKLLRRPNCERCGANLLEQVKGQMLPVETQASGRAVCPRCGQEQDAAQYCKWCGNTLARPSSWRERLGGIPGVPGPAPDQKPAGGAVLRRLVGFLPLILFAVASVAFSELPRQVFEAYKISEPVVRQSARLTAAVGGRLEIGPVPFFYRQSTDVGRRQVDATVHFWVKGPKGSAVARVSLWRPVQERIEWRIGEGSVFEGPDGTEVPLMENRRPGPGPAKGRN
jgi:hypothetical protein